MAHTTFTLKLNDSWDLDLTATGKIAVIHEAQSTAQSVANEIRRFLRDSYFDYDQGIPHFEVELGHSLPESVLRNFVRRAALRVEDVAEITEIHLGEFDRENRILNGNISFRTRSGQDVSITV